MARGWPWLGAALLLTVVATGGSQTVPQDAGATAVWQKLQKLRTTASALHTTAHPDDEHGGLLAMLSRGRGVRVSLATLTRGESGDNAIGPELFDALGLIRTEELLLADRYYGVDRQYFGTVVDYGFSKRLDETLEKWGREHALRDMVGIIRTERPLVVISRFQGNERDGHGNHSAAGLVTSDAFALAADPKAFPEQLAAGLRPWQPLKLYMGGVREAEDWTVRVDSGEYDPVLGDSYLSIARLGLSLQRSQNGGRFVPQPGPSAGYYKRLQSLVDAPARENGFFDGIDTSIGGMYRALRRTAPAGAEARLAAIEREIQAAVAGFAIAEPSRSVPALARALAATREAARQAADEDVALLLRRKEEQLTDAIVAALGVSLTAVAQPPGVRSGSGAGPVPGPVPMAAPVPSQAFDVRTTFVNRGGGRLSALRVSLAGAGGWTIAPPAPEADAAANQPLVHTFSVTVPADAPLARSYFSRPSIQDTRYTVADATQLYRPSAANVLEVLARFTVDGVPVETRRPVTRLDANLPYGYDSRGLTVLPALSVSIAPPHAIVPLAAWSRPIELQVEVVNHRDAGSEGTVRLELPDGWSATPGSRPFTFARAGERERYTFAVTASLRRDRGGRIQAVATSGGRDYRETWQSFRHRDLEPRYLTRDAAALVRGIDVTLPAGRRVGYIMGVGDDVPAGLAQLGASVRMLGERDLAAGELGDFDAIVTGTRAYAVRADLRTYNRRLLDYVKEGGNLIVLYNTQELVPDEYAPYPAQLPANAEEVSEEDAAVEILVPGHPVFTTPNRITTADFDGWVEQRGSKFWSSWDPRYSALIAARDRGQAPQRGGWLHARYGKGHYTYFAYALHRQLPYGVPGAYRLLANLLSLNAAGRGGGAR